MQRETGGTMKVTTENCVHAIIYFDVFTLKLPIAEA